MSGTTQLTIARPSIASLYVQMQFQGNALGSATGFVVERGGSKYLITNFHVVSGRHPDTHTSIRPDGAWPDSIQIVHNAAGRLGNWIPKSEQLYDTMGVPLWFEHPVHRSQVDVVALPLTDTVGIDVHAHDPWASPRVAIQMAGPLSIIGFPFGTAYAGAMAIWVQGFVASEWAMDFGNLPRFLIDSRTREGQSGSPVIFNNVGGGFQDLRGNIGIGGGPFEELMGVYSGRISQESDLGFVWKVSCVREVVQGRVRGTVRGP